MVGASSSADAHLKNGSTIQWAGVVAAVTLGLILELGNGYWVPHAGSALFLAFAIPLAALVLPRHPVVAHYARLSMPTTLAIGLSCQLAFLTTLPAAKYLDLHSPLEVVGLHGLIFAMFALSIAWVHGHQPRLTAAAWLVCILLFGLWVVVYSPAPHTDVWLFGKDAARALWHGQNPYTLTFENIYQDAGHYAPDCANNQRVLHGYPYPPINLIVAAVGQIFGDMRLGLVLCLAATTGVMLSMGKNFNVAWAALLLVTTPRCLMLIEQGFIEPLAIFLVAAVISMELRRPAWTPYALGLLWATKQSMVICAPAALLLPSMRVALEAPYARAMRWSKALATTAGVTLPFALLSPQGFWMSLWHSQQLQPGHALTQTLTFSTPFALRTGEPLPLKLSFALCATVLMLLVMHAPRTASSFALGTGLLSFSFFICNSRAHANYYHFILACFLIAVVAAQKETTNEAEEHSAGVLKTTSSKKRLGGHHVS